MYKSIYAHQISKDAPLPFSLPEWISLAPFEEYLGMHIEEAENGKAILSMPFRAAHCQGAGLMHGGAVTSLADTAMAMAIKSLLPQGTQFVTMELSLTFHAPVRWGTVRAMAQVNERSDRDITGQAEIITEDGIKAATFRAVFRIRMKTTREQIPSPP